jgi:uncharacterized protein YukE
MNLVAADVRRLICFARSVRASLRRLLRFMGFRVFAGVFRSGVLKHRIHDVRFSFELRAMGPHFCRTQRKDIFMSQAIMDPEQVRRFADELQRFNRDLQNRMGSLQARFNALGDSWQDQEQIKFSDEFKQTVKMMKKFAEMSDQHVPYLLRKAQRIEEYLNQR